MALADNLSFNLDQSLMLTFELGLIVEFIFNLKLDEQVFVEIDLKLSSSKDEAWPLLNFN